ncbi:hypothetical protein DPMN_135941 [Dreissena polymorpha]|uniref:Uncharacterized protein n=1 Tax=Dreissena polymorpha TaxID=45954 RepID=A0A9D4FYX8_DREPO|nr:hypothetical protein DPMN_135941 [Dreissena polymorpha]
MASLDATSRRPESQNGFPSTLSVPPSWDTSMIFIGPSPRNPGLYICPRSAPPVFYAASSAALVPLPAM